MSDDLLLLSQATIFLATIWITGQIFSLAYSKLIGEILAGMVLGEVANWVPFDDCITLVGQIGLALLVAEGGLTVDISRLKSIGPLAFIIALTGTVLPCLLGWAFIAATDRSADTLEGIAAGTALSSTSVGTAINILKQLGQLNSADGNLIVTAAMIDDVFSLVILAVLGQLSDDDASSKGERAWQVLKPIVVSAAIIVAGALLVIIVPWAYARYTACWHAESRTQAVQIGFLTLSAAAAIGAGYAGSTYLLGAFVGGMAFSRVPNALAIWTSNSVLSDWLTSIFFASIGFTIPVSTLFSAEVFGLGVAYTIPAVAGKFFTGAFTCNWIDARIVGWAMVGRGELGFVISKEARDDDIISEKTMAISVWALLLSTFISPFFMQRALQRKVRELEMNPGDPVAAATDEDGSQNSPTLRQTTEL